jgi:hypothetical protein
MSHVIAGRGVQLGSASYIRLTSMQDGATQILNAKPLLLPKVVANLVANMGV